MFDSNFKVVLQGALCNSLLIKFEAHVWGRNPSKNFRQKNGLCRNIRASKQAAGFTGTP